MGLCSLLFMLILIRARFYLQTGGTSSGRLWVAKRLGVVLFCLRLKPGKVERQQHGVSLVLALGSCHTAAEK